MHNSPQLTHLSLGHAAGSKLKYIIFKRISVIITLIIYRETVVRWMPGVNVRRLYWWLGTIGPVMAWYRRQQDITRTNPTKDTMPQWVKVHDGRHLIGLSNNHSPFNWQTRLNCHTEGSLIWYTCVDNWQLFIPINHSGNSPQCVLSVTHTRLRYSWWSVKHIKCGSFTQEYNP